MDLDLIDSVHGDALEPGDIIMIGQSLHELLAEDGEDSQGKIIFRTHNLTTGDEARKHLDPDRVYPLYA